MKVIFLDIDGVLNSNDWYVKTRGIGGYNGGDVDPKCIELINDLIDATGSQGWKGWGGEIYFKKYGEIMMDVVDKKKQDVKLKTYRK